MKKATQRELRTLCRVFARRWRKSETKEVVDEVMGEILSAGKVQDEYSDIFIVIWRQGAEFITVVRKPHGTDLYEILVNTG